MLRWTGARPPARNQLDTPSRTGKQGHQSNIAIIQAVACGWPLEWLRALFMTETQPQGKGLFFYLEDRVWQRTSGTNARQGGQR